jgi:serine/threonine protein kinase
MVFGNSLQQLLRNSPESISPIRLANWVHMVVSGLVESHRFDIAHMASSPRNIIVRDDGEAVVVNFCLDAGARNHELPWKVIQSKFLPFPYRMFGDCSCIADLVCADTRAMGILFFQLLCKRPLDGFYDQLQLPKEIARVNDLIQRCLDSSDSGLDSLVSICRRASGDSSADRSSWKLQDFLVELEIWKRCYFLSGDESKLADSDVNLSSSSNSELIGVEHHEKEKLASRSKRPKRIIPQLKKLLSTFAIW